MAFMERGNVIELQDEAKKMDLQDGFPRSKLNLRAIKPLELPTIKPKPFAEACYDFCDKREVQELCTPWIFLFKQVCKKCT